MTTRRQRTLALTAASAVLLSLSGGFVTPANASPVLAADTLRSGAGYAFGGNDKGQTNPASTALTTLGPTQLPSSAGGALKDAVSIAAGKSFATWVDHTGTVWGIGDNSYGQGGTGSAGGVLRTPTKALGFGGSSQPKAVKASAYGLAAVVLDSSGAVWQWGNVVNSQGSNQIASSPTKVSFPTGTGRIIDISAGDTFVLALDDAYKAYAWGKNDRGQLGIGTNNTSPNPSRISGLPVLAPGSMAALEAGRDFGVYAVSSSAGVSIYTWGRNFEHELGNGSSTTDTKSPGLLTTTIPAPAKVLALSAGAEHTLLLTNDGAIRTWGDNDLAITPVPTVVSDPSGLLTGLHHPYTVAAGDGASFAANTDGTVVAWGIDSTGQLGRSTTGTLSVPTAISVPGTASVSLGGVPALITSRQGATYVVTDSEFARTPSASYDFGSFTTAPATGQTAPQKTVTFTNVATKPLSITSLATEGTNPNDFTLAGNTCTGTLAVDSSCSVTVTFAPAGAGARQATLSLRLSNTLGGLLTQTSAQLIGRGYTPVQGLANAAFAWSASSSRTVSGPGNLIDINTLSPSLIPSALPATPDAPLGKLPLGKLPLGKLPLGKLPLGKLPLGKLPLGKLPLGKLPLGKLPLGKLPLGKLPLGKLPLSEIPLLTQGGWADLLSAYPKLKDVPPSALTLSDLLDSTKNAPDGTTTALPLDRVALEDLAVSTSALADVSALAVLGGSLRLDQLGGIDWCSDLPKLSNGGSCTDGAGLKRYLLELDLQGVSLDTTRAAAVTIGQLTTDSLSSTTSPLDDTLLADLSLGSLVFGGTHIGTGISLASLPNLSSLVTCGTAAGQFDCSNTGGKTLADVPAAAFQSGATLRDLGSALNPFTLGQFVELVLDRPSFDWESLPVSAIPLAAYPNRETLVADVDLNCASNSGLTMSVTQPNGGFTAIPGTTVLTKTRGTGTVALADPTVVGSTATYTIPDSTFSSTGPLQCTDDSAHVHITTAFLPTSVAGSSYVLSGSFKNAVAQTAAIAAPAVTVTGINNPPDDTPDGPEASADQLVLGSITTPGASVYVPFEAPDKKVIDVTMSNMTADFDATLYWPKNAAVDPALSGSTAAVQVPFGEAAQGEADNLHPAQSTYGGALQDVPVLTDRPVAAVAATRGTDTEQLSAVARAAGSDIRHVAAISGYNGAVGSFVLRIRLSDAPALASCTATPVTAGAVPSSTFYRSSGWSAGDNTLVLVSTSRMLGRAASASDVTTMLDQLYDYTHLGKGGVAGQVVQVDGDAGVRAAYAAWDASPCDAQSADGVTRAINSLVYPGAPSTLKYVVVVGSDEAIPHARLEDHTRDGNEREEAGDLALAGGNPEAASMASGYYLSDDPYGTRTPQSVLGQIVYLPQAITSRLGESAPTVTAEVAQFMTANGLADPGTAKTAVVTDYDFLANGGNDVSSALTGAGYTVDHSLAGKTANWTEAQLETAFLNKSPAPSVAVLNMHYDQYRALPALGASTGSLSDLYTSGKVASSSSALGRRVVYTIGCHSGLDVPDAYAPGDPRGADFAQAYQGKSTAGMLGNLGFGYADTSTVAYSAQLQSYFTQGLAKGYDLGSALSEAKRLYVDRLAGLSAYDLKSAQQLILWGLPQYHLSGAAATPVPAPPTTLGSVDPITGFMSHSLDVGTSAVPLSFATVNDGTSSHLTATGADGVPHTVAVSGKPVLPAQFVDVPQVAGKVLRSVVPVSLTSNPLTSTTATFARASVDHGQAAEPQANGVFPATLGHVGSSLGSASSNTLVVTPTEFFASGTAAGAGQLRTFPRSQWLAYYGTAGDSTPPSITRVASTRVPANGSAPAVTSYQIDVSAAAGRTISRVYVLALPASGSGTWVRTELTHLAGSRWVGGAAGSLGEFHAIALDSTGVSALSSQKGLGWQPQDLPAAIDPGFPVRLQANPGTPATGWFTTNPSIAIVSNGGSTAGYQLSIDGGAPVGSPATVTGDGVHVVRLVAPDGSIVPGGMPVLVDTVQPVVRIVDSVGPRLELHEAAPYTPVVLFGPSGPKAIVDNGVNGQFPTAAVGAQALTVSATSVAGLTGTASRAYRVVYGSGSTGFLSPVAPVGVGLNIVVPGLVYQFSHHLVDHFGAAVSSGDETGNTVTYTQESCPSNQYKIQLPKISGATAQPVSGGNGNWDWDLTTPNSGVLVCDQMTVLTNDGFTHFDADLQITP